MNFLDFRKEFIEIGCFSVHQVRAWQPDFDKNNITRWVRRGLLSKLRQGFYAFPDYLSSRDFAFYISNCIYKPSYISFHTALAFYGIIPEAVVQITAATSLKTAQFANDFGEYTYKKMRPDLIFGYDLMPFGERTIQFATPEKALLDLLYIYPFYNTPAEIEELRLDENFIQEELNRDRLAEFAVRFGNKTLYNRMKMLLKIHGL